MNRITLKAGVSLKNLKPAGIVMLYALQRVAETRDVYFVITATDNGKHDPNSKHYKGEALDVRSNTFSNEMARKLMYDVMEILGLEYFYGLLEDYDKPNEHFHFQKRKGITDIPDDVIMSYFAGK